MNSVAFEGALALKGLCDKFHVLVIQAETRNMCSDWLQGSDGASAIYYKTLVACTRKGWLGVANEATMTPLSLIHI